MWALQNPFLNSPFPQTTLLSHRNLLRAENCFIAVGIWTAAQGFGILHLALMVSLWSSSSTLQAKCAREANTHLAYCCGVVVPLKP